MTLLSDMRIVVVGASGVLGKAFAEGAADQGAIVTVSGRRDPGLGLPFLSFDVTSPSDADRFADQLLAGGHPVDVIANFTGVHHQPMELGTQTATAVAAEFERVLAVNLLGAFHLTAAAARVLVPQRRGHIIHLCSDASRLSLYGSHAYVASKHGLEGLVRSAAAQLARFGVRVNGLAPGTVETPLNRHLLRDDGGALSQRAAAILAHTPSKQFATIEGVVESTIALCLPQRHLTGNVLFCDDGYAIEGHSWPAGTRAVYDGPTALDTLLERTSSRAPR